MAVSGAWMPDSLSVSKASAGLMGVGRRLVAQSLRALGEIVEVEVAM